VVQAVVVVTEVVEVVQEDLDFLLVNLFQVHPLL
tara:strand:- start:680 stop:781 length:102 start_codon:yes stop_codon:yes gene_type:complete